MEPQKYVKIGSNGISKSTGFLRVFHYDPISREYLGSNEVYIVKGTGIPANSCMEEPCSIKKGQTIIRSIDNSAWCITPDYRGVTVYDVNTRKPQLIANIGKLPDNVTLLPPSSENDKWDGEKWVYDSLSYKMQLLNEAEKSISLLRDEALAGIISDENRQQLAVWVTYRKALQALNVNTESVKWPPRPK